MNNWIDYGLFWLYIYIHGRFCLVYLIPIPMLSLFSWFLYCNTCSKSTKSMKPNGNISTEWPKVLSFVWENVLFCREVICFLINNLFGNVFQIARVTGLIMLLSDCMWTPMLKEYLNSWKRYFLVWQFVENQVFIISALFPYFSVFSLFKLIN